MKTRSTIISLVVALACACNDAAAQSTHDHHRHAKDAADTTTTKVKAPKRDAASPSATHRVVITQGQAGEPPALKARLGETIRIVFASDRPGTAEVHGYKSTIALVPGGEAALLVTADKTGSYPVHLHTPEGAHIPVATLEVAAK